MLVRSIPHSICVVVILVFLFVATFISTTSELSSYSDVAWKREIGSSQTETKDKTLIATQSQISNPTMILKRLLEENYPECRLPTNYTSIHLATMGAYVNVLDSHPPYDHISCFVMKARYNCAYRPDAPFDMAHNYELVLRFPTNIKDCRLKDLIGDTFKEWNLSLSATNITPQQDEWTKPRYHVMLQGNSFVRQLWEALVCKVLLFQRQTIPVTAFSVQVGGPGIALKDFTARENRPVRVDELGYPTTNISHLQKVGCHGEAKIDISAYYRRKAVVPPNLPHCNDNVAMIDIADQWRFYYLFKPTMYTPETLDYIYRQRFGISPDHSDDDLWLLWNSVLKEPQNVTASFFSSVTRQISLESWIWTLRDLQLRDLGRYFGANNPWISKPPDFHACMPGPPDDQVNLLFYLLWSGYKME